MARLIRLSPPRLAALGSALLLAACATPHVETTTSIPGETPKQVIARVERSTPRAIKSKPTPIPTRALNVAAECSFRDETGYAGAMKLSVDNAEVRLFDARVTIPKYGACRFDLKDFRQTRTMPNVELKHVSDRCIVRMWEQGERVTVAFDRCERMCSGDAYNHLWPILTDRRAGSCA